MKTTALSVSPSLSIKPATLLAIVLALFIEVCSPKPVHGEEALPQRLFAKAEPRKELPPTGSHITSVVRRIATTSVEKPVTLPSVKVTAPSLTLASSPSPAQPFARHLDWVGVEKAPFERWFPAQEKMDLDSTFLGTGGRRGLDYFTWTFRERDNLFLGHTYLSSRVSWFISSEYSVTATGREWPAVATGIAFNFRLFGKRF